MGALPRARRSRSSATGRSAASAAPPRSGILSLDLSDLSGVTLYEPEENSSFRPEPETPIGEIEKLLAASDQELAIRADGLRARSLAAAAGARDASAACLRRTSPARRRIKAGRGARSFPRLHGRVRARRNIQVRWGRGGEETSPAMTFARCWAGSYGTLAAMTDVTVKVLPRRRERTDAARARAR